MSHYRHRTDASAKAIAAAFRALGCSVLAISSNVKGSPDFVVGCAGSDRMVEAKPSRLQAQSKAQTLPRASQVAFHESWKGARVHVVHDAKEAAELVNLWRLEASNADRAARWRKRELDAVLAKVNG